MFTKNINQNEEMATNDTYVSIDIGTSKVCVIVAKPGDARNSLSILGVGLTPSEGLSRGVIVNIEKTVHALRSAVEMAEQQSGIKITEAIVGIAGDHIESYSTHEVIGISNPSGEISLKDVQRLLDDSKKISIPLDRRILHVIPQEFIIDGQDGIIEPIGMSGVRMEANVLAITGTNTAITNIYKCLDRVGVKMKDLVLEPIASSFAVIDDEEKEVGVALIDIGAGTTDIAIFESNVLRFTSVIALGGRQVTDDVKKVLGIIGTQAEKIKKEYGHTYIDTISDDTLFQIPGIAGRKPKDIYKSQLCQIIQPRMEEILQFTLSEIRRSGFASNLDAGIVLTGGCALLNGIEELAYDVFGMPVKIGYPSKSTYVGLVQEIGKTIYSTAVGLILYDIQKDINIDNMYIDNRQEEKVEKPLESENKGSNVITKIKKFLEGY